MSAAVPNNGISGGVEDTNSMRVLASPRRSGRTSQAFAWVSQGHQVPGYPGWSRVLVLPTRGAFDTHRRAYWHRLLDYDHRVYTFDDWSMAMGVRPETEVCIDDLDWILDRLMWRAGRGGFPGRIVAATLAARPWEHQEFREGPWQEG